MTHLPNELALKMDGAEACPRFRAQLAGGCVSWSRRAWWLRGSLRREAG